jgi:ribosomal protein L7Ae-like RNA K-turn-binding protein
MVGVFFVYLTSLSQATSATKVGKTRLLLLAPNVEDSEELDERLNALLLEATQRDVPVLYCLSKRLLGKALQMSMKQSVVAVLDPDGAYDLFKLILQAICSKE